MFTRRAALRIVLVLAAAGVAPAACDPGYDMPSGGGRYAGWSGSSGGSANGDDGGGAGGGSGGGTSSGGGTAPDGGGLGMPPPPTPDQTAATCGGCHVTIYKQWQQSQHSHSLTSPAVIAQTNQVALGPFSGASNPDPYKFCVNCHSPSVAALVTGATLPVPPSTHWKDGVTCTTCHQFNGNAHKGGGGFASEYQTGFIAGTQYVGALSSPVGNRAHSSADGADFTPNANALCENCHEVWIDYNHDGVVEKGLDLALQTTWDEYKEYKTLGGTESCVSCHMPVVQGLTRVADGAQIPQDQYTVAPAREVHDHSFVGVDFALDDATQQQAQSAGRTALLQQAATLQIDRGSISEGNSDVGFDVFVENTGTGHNLPSGFAFVRQMWIEVTATDVSQNVVFTSGVLQNPTDDLCDGETLFERGNPMRGFFQGCPQVDDSLTTFQQKLVDLAGFEFDGSDPFDPAGLTKAFQIGNETWLQYLNGGVVGRQRTFDGTIVNQLKPFEEQEFHYDVPLGAAGARGLQLRVRLLFRPLPPYFLRALAQNQPNSEVPQIAPLIGNLETVQMAEDDVSL
jgi:cytochrome c554/c'-like protein